MLKAQVWGGRSRRRRGTSRPPLPPGSPATGPLGEYSTTGLQENRNTEYRSTGIQNTGIQDLKYRTMEQLQDYRTPGPWCPVVLGEVQENPSSYEQGSPGLDNCYQKRVCLVEVVPTLCAWYMSPRPPWPLPTTSPTLPLLHYNISFPHYGKHARMGPFLFNLIQNHKVNVTQSRPLLA